MADNLDVVLEPFKGRLQPSMDYAIRHTWGEAVANLSFEATKEFIEGKIRQHATTILAPDPPNPPPGSVDDVAARYKAMHATGGGLQPLAPGHVGPVLQSPPWQPPVASEFDRLKAIREEAESRASIASLARAIGQQAGPSPGRGLAPLDIFAKPKP